MSLAIVYSRAAVGINAPLVTVEAHLSNGLPAFTIVGLPEAAVRESKERVRSALINAHFEFPARRITINLAPADLPKDGGRFDLPIALAILVASEQLAPETVKPYEFVGELALSGELRPVNGVLSAAYASKQAHRQLIVPQANTTEAAIPNQHVSYACKHLLELSAFLKGTDVDIKQQTIAETSSTAYPDMADVKGQKIARRALEIAAAGQHNILFVGSPGAGKTMLAQRLPGLLPPMTEAAAVSHSQVFSAAGLWKTDIWQQRPFRAPHHTASTAAIVGGGSKPKPGEVSLSHQGILFLDELPEFSRQVLEALREPLENSEIAITRATQKLVFPADFQLVAAMNPCPCGYLNDPQRLCRCTPPQIERYRAKLSGPLLDRIDMHLFVQPVSSDLIMSQAKAEDSETIRFRVMRAHKKQLERGLLNNQLSSSDSIQGLSEQTKQQTQDLFERLKLSARGMTRVLRVARTIADLADSNTVEMIHITEAASYRHLDRQS